MAIAFNPSNILHGNNVEAWFGGDQIFTAVSVEAKLTIDNESVEVLGDPGTYSRYNGYAGTGTLKKYKMDSSYIRVIEEFTKTGINPDITIITSVKQPTTGKTERVALKDVTFTEATLMNMEKKTLIKEEIPFNFGTFELLETI